MYTAPSSSPASIDNGEDIQESTQVVWDHITAKTDTPLLNEYDGVLIACYSVHNLVPIIAEHYPHLAVTGIFEASIVTSLSLIRQTGKWGIVTTGKFWEDHLIAGIKEFLGQQICETNSKFCGVFSTGLTAGDFHGTDITPKMIQTKLAEAAKRLLRTGQVECVVMGCAGMAGLEETIRSAIRDEYPAELADKVHIIDGVKAGIGILEQMVKNKRMFLSN